MTTKPHVATSIEEPLPVTSFKDLNLIEPIQRVIEKVGYELPTPIQAIMIPRILNGGDVLGQAQTGTGKTAAFAFPLLSKIVLNRTEPQVLVLTPTRELAIQVSEAFQEYAVFLPGFHVLAIYGGQEYGGQFRGLNRGAHVIVGTPGRIMDHLERGSLKLEALTTLVIDEADEMLRMGFKEDIEWILEHTPPSRQIALFSATLPPPIRAIAKKYLKEPEEIIIKARTATVEATRQRYWIVSGFHKLDALTRILEVEPFDAVLIFVRTKNETLELSEKLNARGFASVALNGDIPQSQRERTIDQLRSGKLNILIATDVAARGLDVDRISHVINYDVPYDAEAYVHRIGRTGRAGRSGEAILFVSPRERRILQIIERATRQKIEPMKIPSVELVNEKRIATFKARITETLGADDLAFFRELVEKLSGEMNIAPLDLAAALGKMAQGSVPLLVKPRYRFPGDQPQMGELPGDQDPPISDERERGKPQRSQRAQRAQRGTSGGFSTDGEPTPKRERPPFERADRVKPSEKPGKSRELPPVEEGMARFRIEVGRRDFVQPGNIVGAIAGETGLESKIIGKINIFERFCTVDLPADFPQELLTVLQTARICGKNMNISPFIDRPPRNRPGNRPEEKPARPEAGTSDQAGVPEERSSRKAERPRKRFDSERPHGVKAHSEPRPDFKRKGNEEGGSRETGKRSDSGPSHRTFTRKVTSPAETGSEKRPRPFFRRDGQENRPAPAGTGHPLRRGKPRER